MIVLLDYMSLKWLYLSFCSNVYDYIKKITIIPKCLKERYAICDKGKNVVLVS